MPPSARKVFLRRTRRRKKRISSFSRRCGGANSVRLYVRPCTGAALPHLHFFGFTAFRRRKSCESSHLTREVAETIISPATKNCEKIEIYGDFTMKMNHFGETLRALFQPRDLTQGSCWRTILSFATPVILSYLLQQIYTISDAAIVGQTLSAGEVAGVNDTTSIVAIFLQFAFGVSAGFCVVTSSQRRRAGSGGRAPLTDDANRPLGGADGAFDGAGAGAAQPAARVDQRHARQPRDLPSGLYLLRDHLRRHQARSCSITSSARSCAVWATRSRRCCSCCFRRC